MLFSAAMYLPKLLFHGAGLDIMTLIKDVLLGNCFWFTASLAVAEFIILAIVSCFKMKKLWNSLVYYFFCGLLPAAFSVLATNIFGGQQMWVPVMLCITCMLVATVFVYIINRWLPWLLDIRKIKS